MVSIHMLWIVRSSRKKEVRIFSGGLQMTSLLLIMSMNEKKEEECG
jgi:hypothetical protein